jgi:hypothetical protein
MGYFPIGKYHIRFHLSLKNCSAVDFILPLHQENMLEQFFGGGGDCEKWIFEEHYFLTKGKLVRGF